MQAEQPGSQSIQSSQPRIELSIAQEPKPWLHLEARQAPLGQILKHITDKTGAQIHYSVLPEAPVTATCVGGSTQEIMDCLVGKQLGLVAHKPQKDKPAEFWLLGSSVGSCQAVTVQADLPKAEIAPISEPKIEPEIPQPSKKEQSDALLKKLKVAKNSEERVEVLSNMVSVAIIEDPNVRRALDEAAIDSDPAVRGQAISTLANLDTEGSKELLNSALHDNDAAVRLMALDQSGEDVGVLKQGLLDSDSNVRDFATMKLEEINKREQRKTNPLDE